MMKCIVCILLLTVWLTGLSQVQVKGYYKKNGTYVQPHVRSSPDGNPYNNYGFPGNTNPYTGKTATGSPEAYLNNYYNKSSASNLKYIPGRQAPLPTTFKACGNIKAATVVRLNPYETSSELFKAKQGDIALVLDHSNTDFYKVDINSFVGFVSKNYVENLKINDTMEEPANISFHQKSSTSGTSNAVFNLPPPGKFIFETKIKQGSDCLLRLSPRDNSSEIYHCKPDEKVYILENIQNGYYKVSVHGFSGYLDRNCLL